MLIVADSARFDVLNALTLMDNVSFLRDMKVRRPYPPSATAAMLKADASRCAVWTGRRAAEFLSVQLAHGPASGRGCRG